MPVPFSFAESGSACKEPHSKWNTGSPGITLLCVATFLPCRQTSVPEVNRIERLSNLKTVVVNFRPGSEILMPAIFEYHHSVVPDEIDRVGHVNNIEYMRWLQNAAVAHSTAQGWPPNAYYQLGRGWVVRSHFIEYLQYGYSYDL